ncbi:hypothetical protein Hanom_Chr12g01121171 [Helianthus anomalus]
MIVRCVSDCVMHLSLFRVMLSRVRYVILVTNCSWFLNVCNVSLVSFLLCKRYVSGCQNHVGFHRCLVFLS